MKGLRLLSAVCPSAVAACSGLVLWTAFPPLEYGVLAWFGLVPLLLAFAYAERSRQGLWLSWVFGFTYAALCAHWVNVIDGFSVPAYLVLACYISLFPTLFAWLLFRIRQATAWPLALIAPPLWVLAEFLQVEVPLLPTPLPLLGYTQYEFIPLIQIASVTSFYGVSFLIVLVNAALADVLLLLRDRRPGHGSHDASRRLLAGAVMAAMVFPLAAIAWGTLQLPADGKATEPVLRASLVQANIPQAIKWQRSERLNILNRYRDLSLQVTGEQPDLIIWPETSIPDDLKRKRFFSRYVGDLAGETSAYMLVGSSTGEKGRSADAGDTHVYNSAFLINPAGEIAGEYAKVMLIPFGESVPFGPEFPWPEWVLPDKTQLTPGAAIHLLEVPQGRFGVTICWENLFPGFFRQFVRQGAGFMVNLTNEAWFKDSAAGHMLLASAVFRAVENRVSLLRSASTGVSALIDPYGRITDRVQASDGQDLMVAGVLTVPVPAAGKPAFYTRYGDVFAGICIVWAVLMLLRVRAIGRVVNKGVLES